jgi:hypothetical protein
MFKLLHNILFPVGQVECVIMLDVNPLEQFVFSIGANDTIHKGAVRLSVYDYFYQIRQLQKHRWEQYISISSAHIYANIH